MTFEVANSEAMAAFKDEEFFPYEGSQIFNQPVGDMTFLRPKNQPKADHVISGLDFSGIMGEISLMSEGGTKLTVGDFFKKGSERPEFGGNNQKSELRENSIPLVDHSSILTDKDKKNVDSSAFPAVDYSCLNLSEIADILQNENISPLELVDKLLEAKKKKIRSKKQAQMQLDDPTISDFAKAEISVSQSRNVDHFSDRQTPKSDKKENHSSKDVSKKSNSTLKNDEENKATENLPMEENDESLFFGNPQETHQIFSPRVLQNNKYVEIGLNTQENIPCVVGIPTKVNVDIVNKGEKWIVAQPISQFVCGNNHHLIKLDFSGGTMLLKPNVRKFIEIEATIHKFCQPVIAGINFEILDMVTKEKWEIKHTMTFVPENQKIEVFLPSNQNCFDFGNVVENQPKSLSFVVKNQNSVDVVINLQIANARLQIDKQN